MDTENKYLSSEGLGYFIGLTDPLIVSQNEEITSPEFTNENNIIILWGSGTKIKCVAPSNVGYDTRLLYIGTGTYLESPVSISTPNGGLNQVVNYGNGIVLYRNRTSTTTPWPNTFEELGLDDLWAESAMRSKKITGWYNGTTNIGVGIAADGSTSTEASGYLSPAGYYNVDPFPMYSN
jgi:hypothetical protein